MIADYLYHFMPLGRKGIEQKDFENVKSAVLNSSYYFNSPLYFNDPFDCKANFRANIKDNKIRKTLQDQLYKALENVGIFCLSEELYNTLMWSHYTNGHKGVALQFLTQQIKIAVWGKATIIKVTYQNKLPQINPSGVNTLMQMNEIIKHKSRRWKYEKEVRIVLINGKPGIYEFHSMPVRSIFFGCKIDSKYKSELKEIFQEKTSKIYDMQMSSTKFAYKRMPII